MTLLFLLFCFCPSASVCCPCFSIFGPLLLLCFSCSSCLAPLFLRFSACALLLLLFLLSCFPGLASLIFLLHFTSYVFNWNWNLGKFGFYSREGVLWSEVAGSGFRTPGESASHHVKPDPEASRACPRSAWTAHGCLQSVPDRVTPDACKGRLCGRSLTL